MDVPQAAEEQAHKRAQVSRAATFWTARCLPLAFTAWKAGVAERTLQRGKVARSLAAISQHALHASWVTWQAHTLHSKQCRQVVLTESGPCSAETALTFWIT